MQVCLNYLEQSALQLSESNLRQQLNCFSEINPEEYAHLQEAERQKQVLEQQPALRERLMKEAPAQRVATVAAERDEAKVQVLRLDKDGMRSAPSQGRGPQQPVTGAAPFSGLQRAAGQRLPPGYRSDGGDVLEPLDGHGKPLLGDDGRPMTTAEFLDEMRVHPVYGLLFQQRGPAGMGSAGPVPPSGIGSNGEPFNPQAMSAAELYRASFAVSGRSGARC